MNREKHVDEFANRIISIDESMREISSLDELYEDIVKSDAKDDRELLMKKEEAQFARERMLRLSLHVKNLLGDVDSDKPIK